MPASAPTQAPRQALRPNANATDGAANIEAAIRDAQALRKAGDLSGAAKSLSQLVLVAPDNAIVLGEYGKNLAAQGRSDDALAFLERAIELQPGDWTLYSAQGMAYDQKANHRAAQAYARALVMKPGSPRSSITPPCPICRRAIWRVPKDCCAKPHPAPPTMLESHRTWHWCRVSEPLNQQKPRQPRRRHKNRRPAPPSWRRRQPPHRHPSPMSDTHQSW
jgi:hypothetical protein